MHLEDVIQRLRERKEHLLNYNLIYLLQPPRYIPEDPGFQVAQAIGAAPISVMEILIGRYEGVWERLLETERRGQVEQARRSLEDELGRRAGGSNSSVVICDTEILHIFPGLNLTAVLYGLSNEKLLVVSIKGRRIEGGIRLLETGPVYPLPSGCTVFEVNLDETGVSPL